MANPTPEQIRAEAERKKRVALDHIEAAQRSLEHACQELSPIIGALPEYERIGKLSLKVEEEWRRLRYVTPRAGYRLDEDGVRELAKRLAATEPPRG
jgi:hypothetical protein